MIRKCLFFFACCMLFPFAVCGCGMPSESTATTDTLVTDSETMASDTSVTDITAKGYITYEDFGAVGDCKTNDIEAIVKAHKYANRQKLPVRAKGGAVYYIGAVEEGAVIKTDTDWTGALFIIDDSEVSVEDREEDIFTVKSTKPQYDISISGSLQKGQSNLGLTFYGPTVVVLNDKNTKRYIREGKNVNDGSDQTDVVLVDKNGNIDLEAPLLWDYEQVTSAYAIPVDEQTLTIKGGHFITVANQAESVSKYYARGINVNRSNVVVDGLTHTVEGEGEHGAPYTGFLHVTSCADVTVQNCTFTAHKTYQTIGRAGVTVDMGSYDFAAKRTIGLTIRDCKQTTDILDSSYWGLMGTNFCKDITLENCTFSRFDAHQGVQDVTILDSTLGWQCLNAIGTGTLRVENCTLYGNALVNLRGDYGSTWEGDVYIKNCTWVPRRGSTIGGNAYLINGSYSGFHDFGYECYMPKSITIDGLYVKDGNHNSSYNGIYLFANITKAYTDAEYEEKVETEGYPYHLTETVTIKKFTSESGKDWLLSPNTYMFRNVTVIEEDS